MTHKELLKDPCLPSNVSLWAFLEHILENQWKPLAAPGSPLQSLAASFDDNFIYFVFHQLALVMKVHTF